jgi:hypothetical protein
MRIGNSALSRIGCQRKSLCARWRHVWLTARTVARSDALRNEKARSISSSHTWPDQYWYALIKYCECTNRIPELAILCSDRFACNGFTSVDVILVYSCDKMLHSPSARIHWPAYVRHSARVDMKWLRCRNLPSDDRLRAREPRLLRMQVTQSHKHLTSSAVW